MRADAGAAGDPQAETRISVLGRFARVAAGDEADARARYTARLPRAAANSQTRDFQLWEMTVEEVRLVAGFGQIGWLPGAAVVGAGELKRQDARTPDRNGSGLLIFRIRPPGVLAS